MGVLEGAPFACLSERGRRAFWDRERSGVEGRTWHDSHCWLCKTFGWSGSSGLGSPSEADPTELNGTFSTPILDFFTKIHYKAFALSI